MVQVLSSQFLACPRCCFTIGCMHHNLQPLQVHDGTVGVCNTCACACLRHGPLADICSLYKPIRSCRDVGFGIQGRENITAPCSQDQVCNQKSVVILTNKAGQSALCQHLYTIKPFLAAHSHSATLAARQKMRFVMRQFCNNIRRD